MYYLAKKKKKIFVFYRQPYYISWFLHFHTIFWNGILLNRRMALSNTSICTFVTPSICLIGGLSILYKIYTKWCATKQDLQCSEAIMVTKNTALKSIHAPHKRIQILPAVAAFAIFTVITCCFNVCKNKIRKKTKSSCANQFKKMQWSINIYYRKWKDATDLRNHRWRI